MFNVFLRVYVNALLRGNLLAVVPTVIAVAAISVGPFYEGVSKRDPVAIGMMAGLLGMFLVVLGVAVVDRRLNPETSASSRKEKSQGSRPRPRSTGR